MPMDVMHCNSCRDDFYNGKNPHGIKVCWMLKSAKLIRRKRVHINERPPWSRNPEMLPSCYREMNYVFVAPSVNR